MSESPATTPSFNQPISSTAKAIAKDAALSLEPHESAVAVQLGLPIPASAADVTVTRGIGDSIAVVAAHHDRDIHLEFAPHSPLANTLFNEMERLRCETVGAKNRLGVSRNLAELWTNSLQPTFTDDTQQLKLVFTCLTKRALKQPAPLNERQQQVLSKWEATVLNSTSLHWPALFDHRDNQAQYAAVSLAIIATINEDTSNSATDTTGTVAAAPEEPPKKTAEQDTEETLDSEEEDTLASMEMRDDDNQQEEVIIADSSDTKFEDDETHNRDAPVDADSESNGAALEQAPAPYKSYSSTFDEIVSADTLYSSAEKAELRLTLDAHIERHKKVVGRLSGQLQRVLMAQQNRHWKFDLEEGLLDTSRITRIVTQPYSGLSFKEESDIEFKNTVVTLLVDNSKSMLGKPIAIAAACTDILTQTLERCGVTVEILGFTTTELHGGAMFNNWKKQGKPDNPGRLNGLRHIVYKSADTPYRRARENFGVMLQKDLLKQNIDGEALVWAADRLQRRPEERKILMVISDGAPIDTSTMTANRDNYLIDHLHKVINDIENRTTIQLAAIGIGHDVSPYYQSALTIRDAKDLGKTLLTQLRTVMAPPDAKAKAKAKRRRVA